jgi:hypothetical protein
MLSRYYYSKHISDMFSWIYGMREQVHYSMWSVWSAEFGKSIEINKLAIWLYFQSCAISCDSEQESLDEDMSTRRIRRIQHQHIRPNAVNRGWWSVGFNINTFGPMQWTGDDDDDANVCLDQTLILTPWKDSRDFNTPSGPKYKPYSFWHGN